MAFSLIVPGAGGCRSSTHRLLGPIRGVLRHATAPAVAVADGPGRMDATRWHASARGTGRTPPARGAAAPRMWWRWETYRHSSPGSSATTACASSSTSHKPQRTQRQPRASSTEPAASPPSPTHCSSSPPQSSPTTPHGRRRHQPTQIHRSTCLHRHPTPRQRGNKNTTLARRTFEHPRPARGARHAPSACAASSATRYQLSV